MYLSPYDRYIYKKLVHNFKNQNMKLSSVLKAIWSNIYYKQFTPVATNVGNFGRCAWYISDTGNTSRISAR